MESSYVSGDRIWYQRPEGGCLVDGQARQVIGRYPGMQLFSWLEPDHFLDSQDRFVLVQMDCSEASCFFLLRGRDGAMVDPSGFESIHDHWPGQAYLVGARGKLGFIDADGWWLYPAVFDHPQPGDFPFFFTVLQGPCGWGVIENHSLFPLVPFRYAAVHFVEHEEDPVYFEGRPEGEPAEEPCLPAADYGAFLALDDWQGRRSFLLVRRYLRNLSYGCLLSTGFRYRAQTASFNDRQYIPFVRLDGRVGLLVFYTDTKVHPPKSRWLEMLDGDERETVSIDFFAPGVAEAAGGWFWRFGLPADDTRSYTAWREAFPDYLPMLLDRISVK
jgi:hypothetical protein